MGKVVKGLAVLCCTVLSLKHVALSEGDEEEVVHWAYKGIAGQKRLIRDGRHIDWNRTTILGGRAGTRLLGSPFLKRLLE